VTTPAFALLVPIKDARDAKSRLGSVGDERRMTLMAAFARDAITAARSTPLVTVYVVGDPSALGVLLADLDVPVLPDEGDGSLNRALARAAERVAEPGRGVAALLADLPCLRTPDLEAALTEAWGGDGRSYVADAAGTGTTLLAANPGVLLDPRFGAGSAAAHAASGAHPLIAPLPSLRLDVDTTEDLADALTFGVGAHTARATADLA
jgi:2-phospho-L-lactate/phosphoenolpyruvate guanylyltransferase